MCDPPIQRLRSPVSGPGLVNRLSLQLRADIGWVGAKRTINKRIIAALLICCSHLSRNLNNKRPEFLAHPYEYI